MTLTIGQETQQRIEQRMKKGGYPTIDELVHAALTALDELEAEPLDGPTLDAIDRAEAQIARGEHRDWQDVKSELQAKYFGK